MKKSEHNFRLFNIFTFCFLAGFYSTPSQAKNSFESLQKEEVVKKKLFPKQKTFEISAPDFGLILNESYVETYLLHFGATYFLSENWGVGVDAAFAISQKDKAERECIENFYNDPDYIVAAECGPSSEVTDAMAANAGTFANMGPAYVPIRQIDSMFAIMATWSPLYGKQLLFYRGTSYFDLFLNAGLGLTSSTFYPKSTTLLNGNPARGPVEAAADGVGAQPEQVDLYGKNGRPAAESQSNISTILGVGQKYHFAERFHIKVELRNYILLGTDSGFDSFFTLWGGFGVRF